MKEQFRAGYVAIVGEPNVGKSTLLNAILGEKLSIVTAKPQTTRNRVLGIHSTDEAQIVFLDTPGIIKPQYLLHRKMVDDAYHALRDADLVLVLTEVSRGAALPEEVEQALKAIPSETPVFLIINKADTIYKPNLLPFMDAFLRRGTFREVIPISALKQQNLEDLVATILRYLPEHAPFYPTDILSEQPERFFVAELIREKIFERFEKEVPYSTAVEIQEFKDRDGGGAYILADIVVERDTQKAILIGKRGDALKSVGASARVDIEKFLGRRVFLELFVKVREHWREKESSLRNLGYGGERNSA